MTPVVTPGLERWSPDGSSLPRQPATAYRTRLIGLLDPHQPFKRCTVCQNKRDNIQYMDVFHAFLAELNRRDVAPKTRERYSQVASLYRVWLDENSRNLDHISAADFLADLRNRNYAPRTVLLYYHALQLLFTFIGSPLKLKLRKPKTLPVCPEKADIEALIRQAEIGLRSHTPALKKRNVAMITFMAYTGARRSEVVGLRVCDVDFSRRLISLHGKGQKDRMIPMHDRIIYPLRQMCAGKAAGQSVFGVSEQVLYRAVRGLSRRVGLHGFHPHSTRHYFASRLLEKGADIRAVQELLGHEDLNTTAVYLSVTARRLESAVANLDAPDRR